MKEVVKIDKPLRKNSKIRRKNGEILGEFQDFVEYNCASPYDHINTLHNNLHDIGYTLSLSDEEIVDDRLKELYEIENLIQKNIDVIRENRIRNIGIRYCLGLRYFRNKFKKVFK